MHPVARRYPDTMACHASLATVIAAAGLLCASMTGTAQAEAPIGAKLVRCGADSCLRLSGHRAGAEVAVRVDGHDLHVEGERAWRATVPLSTARTWAIGRGYSVAVTLVDVGAGTERRQSVALPPGSLGSRLELASLVVRAH